MHFLFKSFVLLLTLALAVNAGPCAVVAASSDPGLPWACSLASPVAYELRGLGQGSGGAEARRALPGSQVTESLSARVRSGHRAEAVCLDTSRLLGLPRVTLAHCGSVWPSERRGQRQASYSVLPPGSQPRRRRAQGRGREGRWEGREPHSQAALASNPAPSLHSRRCPSLAFSLENGCHLGTAHGTASHDRVLTSSRGGSG